MVISRGTNDFSFCRAAASNRESARKKEGENWIPFHGTGFDDTFMGIFCSKIFLDYFYEERCMGSASILHGRQ